MSLIFVIIIMIILLYLFRLYIRGGINKLKHSMKGKIIIITGASSGLGLYSALDLIDSGAKVIFACRNETKAKNSINSIKNKLLRENAEYFYLDLCNFQSIKNFVEIIKKKYNKIDILMNNAGAGPTEYKITSDGYESFLQGNYLGPCLLTLLLLNNFNEKGRIIFLGSVTHYITFLSKGDSKYFSDEKLFKNKFCTSYYSQLFGLYATTKLLILLFSKYLAKYCKENKKYSHIKVVCCHPGFCNTNFMKCYAVFPWLYYAIKIFYPIFYYISKTEEDGAQTQLYLCYINYEDLKNGKYYRDCKEVGTSSKANEEEMINEFSEWTIKELSKKYELECFKA